MAKRKKGLKLEKNSQEIARVENKKTYVPAGFGKHNFKILTKNILYRLDTLEDVYL